MSKQPFQQQPPFINEFYRGLNTDCDPRNQPEGTYRDMTNMSLTGEGAFYSPENIRGSINVADILEAGTYTDFNILGAFECYPKETAFPDYLRKHIVIFLAFKDSDEVWHSRLFFLNTETGDLLEMRFSDTSGDEERQKLNFPPTGTVDAVIFGERGYSNIYFEDNVNPMRKIECLLEVSAELTWAFAGFAACVQDAPRSLATTQKRMIGTNPNVVDTYNKWRKLDNTAVDLEADGDYFPTGESDADLCPITYHSAAISRSSTLARNDCGAFSLGGPWTINVAYDAYTSEVSQAAADALADADADAQDTQPNANLNGTCTALNIHPTGNGFVCTTGMLTFGVTRTAIPLAPDDGNVAVDWNLVHAIGGATITSGTVTIVGLLLDSPTQNVGVSGLTLGEMVILHLLTAIPAAYTLTISTTQSVS